MGEGLEIANKAADAFYDEIKKEKKLDRKNELFYNSLAVTIERCADRYMDLIEALDHPLAIPEVRDMLKADYQRRAFAAQQQAEEFRLKAAE